MAKKEKKELKALYLKVESLNDLMRSAISEHQTRLIAMRYGNKYRLMTEAEKLEGNRLILYFETDKIGKFIFYSVDDERGENSEMVENVAGRGDHYRSYKLPILETTSHPYSETKEEDLKEMMCIEAKDYSTLTRFLVTNMSGEDSPPAKVYAFFSKNYYIVGTFDVFWEHGRIFTYAKMNTKQKLAALNYDYNSDMVEQAHVLHDSNKVIIRAINLSSAFPFFEGI